MNDIKVPFYSMHAQHVDCLEELKSEAIRIIDSGHYILGEPVETFESKWAAYCGRKHAIAVGNGLEAITLVIKALNLRPTGQVVTVANSFIASALGVTNAGRPVGLVDCGEDFLMDVSEVEKLDARGVSCIIPVHLYGQMADMTRLKEWANRYRIPILEDAAQCHGASRDGRKPGDGTLAATFSFYPGKNLGALGDAGGIVTDDDELAKKLRMLRAYGSVVKYHHDMLGTNSRLDTLQAALLTVKLKYLDKLNCQRFEIAGFYDEKLKGIPQIKTPVKNQNTVHVYHQYVIQAERRDELKNYLEKNGVHTLIHYPIPIHKTKAYATELSRVKAPRTERMADEILSIPIWPGMTSEMCEKVVDSIRSFY